MILSIAASSFSKTRPGNVQWGALTYTEEIKYEPGAKQPISQNRGDWFWFPSYYMAYPNDLFWREKQKGRWYSLWDINSMLFYADGRDEHPSLIVNRYFRPNTAFYTKGPGTLMRGDTFDEDGQEDTDGESLTCQWQLVVSMPDNLRPY